MSGILKSKKSMKAFLDRCESGDPLKDYYDIDDLASALRRCIVDMQRLDWLEGSQGHAVVSDDDSHWAVVTDGVQDLLVTTPDDLHTSFFIRKHNWRTSVREAIDAAIQEEDE